MDLSETLFKIQMEAQVSFVTGSGPGGQNINRRKTKAFLRWNLLTSSISAELREILKHKLRSELTHEGELVLTDQSFRSQERNEVLVRKKLEKKVVKALYKPKPRKRTRPSKAQKKKRLDNKKKQSDKKRTRQKVDY